MKYQKGYAQIQREKAGARLKSHLLFWVGMVLFLIVLGIVGAVAR